MIMAYFPKLEDIMAAAETIRQVARVTPLEESIRLSTDYGANILLKRDDLRKNKGPAEWYAPVLATMPKG